MVVASAGLRHRRTQRRHSRADAQCHCYEAELHRLRGEILLARSDGAPDEAEGCFRRSLEVARRQSARSLELRGAMSLGRLLRVRGDVAGATELLSGVYRGFTQGFDHPDLREARALLEAWSAG